MINQKSYLLWLYERRCRWHIHFANVYSTYHCLPLDEVFLKIDRFLWFLSENPKLRRQSATPKNILIPKYCHHWDQHGRNNGNSLVHILISKFVSKWRTLMVTMKFGMLITGLGENVVPIDDHVQTKKCFLGLTLVSNQPS